MDTIDYPGKNRKGAWVRKSNTAFSMPVLSVFGPSPGYVKVAAVKSFYLAYVRIRE
jgi:hypothetical protein